MSEYLRYLFLVNRDGIYKAREWQERTAQIYRNAAVQAADPDTAGGAKGMEWATKYCDAAKECDRFA